MKYLLQDKDSGLYVGSHSARHAQLQIEDYAYIFKSREDLDNSLNLMEKLNIQWEIINVEKDLY